MKKFIGRKTCDGKIIQNDEDLCLYLLHTANVVAIPGSKFFGDGHIRLAYASSSVESIRRGAKLMSDALLTLL